MIWIDLGGIGEFPGYGRAVFMFVNKKVKNGTATSYVVVFANTV